MLSNSPGIIDFSLAFAYDQYGNQFESAPTSITILCNPNSICEADENFLFCPEDCSTGIEDGNCDAAEDGINDPDCAYGIDPDYNPNDDTDNDGVADQNDICPGYPDIDSDSDGKPDNCDICPLDEKEDIDNDGFCGNVDNCPSDYNPGQEDINGNGKGDVCEPFSMLLLKGWNLISIPLNLINNTLPEPLKSIEGSYSKIFTSIHGKLIELKEGDEINETIGLWIKMLNNDTLEIEGSEITSTVFNLVQGWNLIGYPSLNETLINETPINNSTVYSYNGSWLSYVTNRTINSLEILKPGYGYWVKT